VALLGAWVQQRAAELDINASILAPPKLLEKCVTTDTEQALRGWRASLLANDFNDLLGGRRAVAVDSNGLILAE